MFFLRIRVRGRPGGKAHTSMNIPGPEFEHGVLNAHSLEHVIRFLSLSFSVKLSTAHQLAQGIMHQRTAHEIFRIYRRI
jgi:hypothetical protein